MSGVRLLVGTQDGAFILTSDAKRKDGKVDGSHFCRLGDLSHERVAG
jgi:hypothetical protein